MLFVSSYLHFFCYNDCFSYDVKHWDVLFGYSWIVPHNFVIRLKNRFLLKATKLQQYSNVQQILNGHKMYIYNSPYATYSQNSISDKSSFLPIYIGFPQKPHWRWENIVLCIAQMSRPCCCFCCYLPKWMYKYRSYLSC